MTAAPPAWRCAIHRRISPLGRTCWAADCSRTQVQQRLGQPQRGGDHGIGLQQQHFEEPPGAVGPDVQVAITLIEHTNRIAYHVFNVRVRDAVLARMGRDLHLTQVTLPIPGAQDNPLLTGR